MKNKTIYVGIDVDDTSFHFNAVCKDTGEFVEGKTKPNGSSLLKQLDRLKSKHYTVKCCYEASYCGFGLQRFLSKNGFDTQVIAPSSLMRRSGKHIKTDRLDAKQLAIQFSNDQLTYVNIPSDEDIQDRSLVRTRSFLVDQRKSLKQHILSLCRFSGLDYKGETGGKEYWTKTHSKWLISKIKDLRVEFKMNLDLLLQQLDSMNNTISSYEEKIEQLTQTPKYKSKVDALVCFKGVKVLTAMTLITEIGDINRFDHPTKLTSYCGMDLREYSSGGKERRFGITKMGNVNIRTAAIESCQKTHIYQRVGERLKKRRLDKEPKIISIAEKCQKRLYKRSNHLLDQNKNRNKVKVAVAREFLGFVWATLKAVA